ncbi:regulatory protein [Raoultella ornithinolytica]|uniref:anaerobic sulfatase maturase n=1 Tax=Raoultella ornithinolytica TaxID=54291 RepID=UPI000B5A6E80|nr:anaerobic sulfatase maturase [Raoultella ornithinolytica]KAB8153787.1 anaerobic sulfatase maturase [Raoultella ornithinolytica]KAB8163120.1 anaerobic sulfatase maturase [Raoultella ornithinolytica]MCT4741424.1 anaerobic sulfatase maturase [Raoultella ornithinolytica]MCW9582204.1 anaerobic sulfatase maturase [Raoultella ornithinolytica]MEB5727969.1 anaerobic sulfatase maturase [Raoultella ornithinolytica]
MTITGCHVMAKPTGSVCNIDCTYCFYLEKEALYPERNTRWQMSDETLERYIGQHIDAQSGDNVTFAWQGGEPTMMGLAFFRRVIALCDKYANGKKITHALQTNGILLDDAWARFFAEHRFLIGLSIDGPAPLHNQYRVNRTGKGTHDRVMAAMALLKAHHVEFNTLTVVGKHNVEHAREVYEFLVAAGSRYIQFIPLVERLSNDASSALQLVLPGESAARLAPWTVPSWQFGDFLRQIFDVWVRRDVERVSVQMFDVAMAAWTGQPPVLCVHSATCGHAFALESNGDLYNCDHFVYPEHKLGNIHQQTIHELNHSERAIAFGEAKETTLTADCRRCEFRPVCHGGCPKHRFAVSPNGHPGHNYLCAGYKHFFKHITPYMNVWQQLLESGYPPSSIMQWLANEEPQAVAAVRRNDPCPCGSGRKYKKCCAE